MLSLVQRTSRRLEDMATPLGELQAAHAGFCWCWAIFGKRRDRIRARSARLVAMHVAPTFAAVDFRPVGSVVIYKDPLPLFLRIIDADPHRRHHLAGRQRPETRIETLS